ncbi:unnamed protein product [Kluyveromyces dobzhanskii CBS 2104]|uniref:WGS project CCBQ000000000 data, contig 00106 n=1 Tax=Kluyveromyces dobzhanskii CBS 2104 TaxID=1427455 RepID=A0A0A8L6C4_9SACH|nr:unnamed protein product [Kluyveromyces dobzhanskii CBS 2104]
MDCFWKWVNQLWLWFHSVSVQRQLSIAVVGLQNSGKTTFTNLLAGKEFAVDTIPTLGINVKNVKLPNRTNLTIYDLAGQTRFQKLWERCFQQADLLVFMIDISDLTTWEQAKNKLHDVIIATNLEHVPILILGNKKDLLPKFPADPLNAKADSSSQQATFASVENSTRKQTWKYVSPLLHNYEYEDIPKYDLCIENQHVLSKVEILSKELGIDLKQGLLHLPHNSKVKLNRDIALFCVSCKDGTLIETVMDWILEL